MARKKEAEVLVHPVPPVLDASRAAVRTFNAAVAAEIAKLGPQQQQAEGSACSPGGVVRWLDVEGQLLQGKRGEGETLAEGLEFDGIHLAPEYVSLLDAALAKL